MIYDSYMIQNNKFLTVIRKMKNKIIFLYTKRCNLFGEK